MTTSQSLIKALEKEALDLLVCKVSMVDNSHIIVKTLLKVLKCEGILEKCIFHHVERGFSKSFSHRQINCVNLLSMAVCPLKMALLAEIHLKDTAILINDADNQGIHLGDLRLEMLGSLVVVWQNQTTPIKGDDMESLHVICGVETIAPSGLNTLVVVNPGQCQLNVLLHLLNFLKSNIDTIYHQVGLGPFLAYWNGVLNLSPDLHYRHLRWFYTEQFIDMLRSLVRAIRLLS